MCTVRRSWSRWAEWTANPAPHAKLIPPEIRMKDADPSAVHWEWFLWPKRRKVAFSVVASESSGGGSHFLGDISDSFTRCRNYPLLFIRVRDGIVYQLISPHIHKHNCGYGRDHKVIDSSTNPSIQTAKINMLLPAVRWRVLINKISAEINHRRRV